MDVSRVTRSKKAAKSSYDRLGKWYDLFVSPFEGEFIDTGLHKVQAAPGEVILEIGFGTGQGILKLARAVGNSGRIYGIDISNKMCEITRLKVEKAGFSKWVQLISGDALSLPFPGSSFNAIFMSFTLELFDTPEIPLVLKECQRVLKKDGRLCVVAMKQKHDPTPMLKLYEWAHRIFPNYIDCRPIFVREMLEEASFHILDTADFSSWGLPVEVVVCRNVKK
ncbi:2-heptaprenyl-1,4-naphthoquinone methyltransferase [Methanosarcina siciliae T4/M]|uniref:2-heptaprenyl-1,4-naphthoquinone methyltransferase n=1 Tax=Methanosarcina siciliae T4/M TaxID=1434120 RepID=A0A0E3P3D9_9EURY|nr:class I SAM-dependent methyltransferase [Methanosarcina siciliae]AKB28163.1 2-heptaprenyl-1,4-naphthoquinone methyltransferase [Methanosarcina siciliae T4/M]